MSHPPIDRDDAVIPAQYADPEDVFYLDWARETYKQSLPRLLDSLQRVITLATALLGGAIFVASAAAVPDWFRVPAMSLFLVSLSVAFYGTMPYSESVELNDPGRVREFKRTVAAFRANALWYASAALWLGLLVGGIGAMLRAIGMA
jgi:hypothetical protein